MAALSGRDLLLKVADGAVFRTCAGLRAKTLTLNARSVDVTDSDSQGWRDLLPGAGLRTAEITGSGVFRNAASDARLRTAFFEQTALSCQFFMPGFAVISGEFLVSRLKYAGTFDGEAAFEMTFLSAGEVTFGALS